MEDLLNIAIKSFRGGISPDGDKGPRGSFKFGKNLDIHGGADTLKSNQKMKVDLVADGTTISDLPRVILPASDGSKFAFGDTGKIYRKQSGGAWEELYDLSTKVTGATEYESITGKWILIATPTALKKILLRHATNLDDWTDRVIDVGNFDSGAEGTDTFQVTFDVSRINYWREMLIEPSASIPPEVVGSERSSGTSSQTTISASYTVSAKANSMLLIFVGAYANSANVTGVDVSGTAATAISGNGSGSSGSFNISHAAYRLLSPTAGAKTITATFSGATSNRFIYVVEIEGVSQTTPVTGNSTEFGAEGTSTTLTVAETGTNQLRIAVLMTEVATFSPATTQTTIETGTVGTAGTDAMYYRMPFVAGNYDHPMRVAVGSTYVCDGPRLAMYDFNDAFTTEALALPSGFVAKTLLDQSTEATERIIIGCTEEGLNRGWMVTWDGSADSWLAKKPVKASGVNMAGFLEGGVVIQAGDEGDIKYWNFSEVHPLRRVPGVDNGYAGGYTEYRAMTHFALNGGTKNGVYSIGRVDLNSPIAINLEYVPSHGATDDCEIGAIAGDGDDLYIGWANDLTGTPVYGIDIIDHSNKATAVYESLELDMGRAEIEKFVQHIKIVLAEAIPDNAEVQVSYKGTRDTDWVLASQQDDDDELSGGSQKKGFFDAEAQGETYEVQVTLVPSGNAGPEVSSINNYYSFDNSI